ncbi:MAG: bifunctional tetrahydrofolate synthase/dihydrofolate synthase [Betaproteobacteria bacterium]|nr:bifunctional tetrahydrofolate synthase/dihydrofolate synthase [Betaproteobacteria bacterium]
MESPQGNDFPHTLADWLAHLERLRPKTIELGLARVQSVWARMGITVTFPILTVGGTNGKGSTCAFLESMLRCAGYAVASYSSPHLLRYNERVRVRGKAVDDETLCAALRKVEAARGSVPLTFFEFGTLAAMQVFVDAAVEVAVMEVGLGGRLDAVNLFQPSCAAVTQIGIDHVDYLGPTRESIGFEKAGIFRPGVVAICADDDPPASLTEHARAIAADLKLTGQDFGWRAQAGQWEYWSWRGQRKGLPWPALRGRIQLANAATAMAVLDALHERLPVDMGAVRRGLVEVELQGRFQVLPGQPVVVLDVAHNPSAARRLAENLADQGKFSSTMAVLGMLKDKDIEGVVAQLASVADRWFLADLSGPRAATAQRLARALESAGAQRHSSHASPAEAFATAESVAQAGDRIVVSGSFYTVAGVLALLGR